MGPFTLSRGLGSVAVPYTEHDHASDSCVRFRYDRPGVRTDGLPIARPVFRDVAVHLGKRDRPDPSLPDGRVLAGRVAVRPGAGAGRPLSRLRLCRDLHRGRAVSRQADPLFLQSRVCLGFARHVLGITPWCCRLVPCPADLARLRLSVDRASRGG